MNPGIINRLLLSKTRPVQLAISVAGTALGLFIMMCGLQLWTDVRSIMKDKDMLGDDYIIISKKVNLLNTLGGGPGRFGKEEIEEIRKVKGIDDVGAFTPGKFKAGMEMSASLGDFGGQLLKTDLFFEAVPDRYMDISRELWRWKEGDRSVPIVIPADIIRQYNHAFAASQGLPVIPESMITGIEFDVHLRGNGKQETLRGRITGFSNRINSILVPQAFLDYGNRVYGDGPPPAPSRLILHTDNPASPSLVEFFRANNYDLNEEKLRSGRTGMLLQLVMVAVALLGAFIVWLALLGFIQYTQLLAYRSAYEIQTLHWLGYDLGDIRKPYDRFGLRNLLLAMVIALVMFGMAQWGLQTAFEARGFHLTLKGWMLALPGGLLAGLLMLAINRSMVKKQVETLAR